MMEDCWTVCWQGLGIVSIVSPGQEGCDSLREMQEKLEDLDRIVTQYMKANGIKEDKKDSLMECILLWNGYREIPWEYKSTETGRAFCTYMEKENPALFNYFERGLYLGEGEGQIDLTYMLGIYKAAGTAAFVEDCITEEMTGDAGMFNGYLEAVRMEQGKGMGEVLSDFLSRYGSPEYDSRSRYEDFASRTTEETRACFCRDYFIDASEMGVQEINLMMLERRIRDDYELGGAADVFLDRLRTGLASG